MSRLTLSDADKQVRDWFVKTTESLGCKVQIDAMGMINTRPNFDEDTYITIGNIFAVRPGKKAGPPTFAG
jgi:acetylornithine deacetylase/succinyl-diaminopimelate desuccinylase-like protein